MSYSFRFRFDLPPTQRLDIKSNTWEINDDGKVCMHALKNNTDINLSENIVVIGDGFSSEQEALHSGEFYQDVLRIAFAKNRVGADFGYLSKRGGLSNDMLKKFEQDGGQCVIDDSYELMVFETSKSSWFFSAKLTGIHGFNSDLLKKSIDNILIENHKYILSDKDRIAYGLFSLSFFEKSVDARFLVLVMAIEMLISPKPRSESVRTLVDQIMEITKNAAIPDNEKKSILGSIQWLYRESIGQAGRKLSGCLNGKKYNELPPDKFFSHCYGIRSSLVHSNDNRPAKEEISDLIPELINFVGDLICAKSITEDTQ